MGRHATGLRLAGGYVYAFGADGSDLRRATSIYVKSEAPGEVVVPGRSGRPRAVDLVDVSPLGKKTLEALAWSSGRHLIEIVVDLTSQAYRQDDRGRASA